MYPFLPGICRSLTSSRTNSRSGVATSSSRVSAMALRLLELFGLLQHFFDRTLHVEGLFRQIVVLAFDDFPEALDGIGQLDVFALETGELLGNVEGLGEELLNFTGARHGQLVFVGK